MAGAFSNTDYVTDGKIGVDLTKTYSAPGAWMSGSLLGATPNETVITSNNGKYVFARAHLALSAGMCVIGSPAQTSASATPYLSFVPLTTTIAIGGAPIAFSQQNVPASSWAWFQLQGNTGILLATGTNPALPLFTSATAGVLTGTTGSVGLVQGVVAVSSCTGGPSIVGCFANNPHLLGITAGQID